MLRRLLLCVLFLCLAVAVSSPLGLLGLREAAAGAQKTVAVTDLRLMRHATGNGTRLVLDINAAVPYRSFALNNPPRLVVDLPRMAWQAPMNKGDRNRTVKSYRVGVFQGDTLRLVLELNRPALIEKQTRLSPESGRGWQYVFDIKPADPIEFRKNLQKVATGGESDTPPAAVKKQPAQTQAASAPTVIVPPKATQTASSVVKKPMVVIDAGHGGVDPGAIAMNGAYEKTITLATAKELQRLLLASGKYRVKMTRDRDVYIKLPERVRIARAAGGDIFISLHADALSRKHVAGASVYTLSNTASDAETAKLAERENAVDSLVNVNVGDVDSDVADILLDLVTRDTMNQSKILAETVVSTFKAGGIKTLPINPHRSAGFAVLKSPDIPSVLIEMGFLSNKKEADNLASDAYRKKIAAAVAKIIDRYFNETSKAAY